MHTTSKSILSNQPKLMKTLRLVIHGRVQGVFFRDSMRREAQNLSVCGWVRNRSDGTVEAVVHGEPAAVDSIVRWAQNGPQHAKVVGVEIGPYGGNYNSFEVTV
jgi:acylphosphatase